MSDQHQIRPDVCRILGLEPTECEISPSGKGADLRPIPVTLAQYEAAVRVKIAELEGYESVFVDSAGVMRGHKDGSVWIVPDYCHDLNTCHGWYHKLTAEQKDKFVKVLYCIVGDEVNNGEVGLEVLSPSEVCACLLDAIAIQWCEARIIVSTIRATV